MLLSLSLSLALMFVYAASDNDQFSKKHRFLTEGPWTPKGSVERVEGVREGHKSKVLCPCKPFDRESSSQPTRPDFRSKGGL